MRRSVHLHGQLGERFGHKFEVEASSCQDIFRCINANRPNFLQYIRECHEQDIGFSISVQDEDVTQDTLLQPLEKGDVFISIVPAGSKDGVKKVLAAIAIVTLVLPLIGMATAVGPGMTYTELLRAGAAHWSGQLAIGMAANLAIVGIAEIMAPDPEGDDSPTNYLFNGGSQNIEEGDPVPVLYGELRVPGRPIAINIINGLYTNPTSILEADGSISALSTEPTEAAGE